MYEEEEKHFLGGKMSREMNALSFSHLTTKLFIGFAFRWTKEKSFWYIASSFLNVVAINASSTILR